VKRSSAIIRSAHGPLHHVCRFRAGFGRLFAAAIWPAAEAEREIASAKRLDPLSVAIHIDQAYILHYYQRNDRALRCVQLALEMNPNFPLGYFWLGRIYTSEQRY